MAQDAKLKLSISKFFPLGAFLFIGNRKEVEIDALLFSRVILTSDDATVVHHYQNYTECSFSISLHMRSSRNFPTKGCGFSISAKVLIIIACEKIPSQLALKKSIEFGLAGVFGCGFN